MTLNQRLIKLLLKMGLNRSEADIFLIVNQNPKLSLKEIQQKSGYSLAQIYRAYEKLRAEGLLTSSNSEWRKEVETISLKTLGEKLLKEQRKLGKIARELKELSNLNDLNKNCLLPDPIEVLTDQNQIIEKNYQILAQPWSNMAVYGASQVLIDVIGSDHEHNFVDHRVRKGKSVNVTITSLEDEYYQEAKATNEHKLRNMKVNLIPNIKDSMVYIYDQEVTIWKKDALLGNRAIVIKEPALVSLQQKFFDQVWNGSV